MLELAWLLILVVPWTVCPGDHACTDGLSLTCRNGTSARGPWLLEEILRWGTERLFNAHAEQRGGPVRESAGVPRPDAKPEADAAEQATATGTEARADAAADKGSNADVKPEAGGNAKEEQPHPVVNEASAYSDAALDALIRWGTGSSGGDASSGEVPPLSRQRWPETLFASAVACPGLCHLFFAALVA